MTEIKVILLGAGGHAKRCVDIFMENGFIIDSIFDDFKTGYFYRNTKIEGRLEDLRNYLSSSNSFNSSNHLNYFLFCAIGDNKLRQQICSQFLDYQFTNCISRRAYISPTVQMGTGNFIGDFSLLSSDSKIGSFNIINDGANFNHDCEMGNCNHISLNSAFGGAVQMEDGNLIGIGANINPKIKIGNWNIVGSGAVIIKPILDRQTIVGVPGKEVHK